MGQTITVHKLDHQGQIVFEYSGVELERTPNSIVLEAYFALNDYPTAYHTFKKGDRMVEWFFSDHWYNIFALHHRDSDTLEGWYCNITRPARLETDAIYAEDLALDVMVYPDGRTHWCWMRMNLQPSTLTTRPANRLRQPSRSCYIWSRPQTGAFAVILS